MKKRRYLLPSLVLVCGNVSASDDIQHLMSMSLEELSMLQTEMQTAFRSSHKLTDTPSSVYVLGSERIKRSGARSIAEVLALVPGITVTNVSNTQQVASIRGFHDGLYNKMLVLLDGRSLNNSVYGGIYWPSVDYNLADIERIEVLRGPGGTMWGGNALNGVINIITKSAKQTQFSMLNGTFDEHGDYIASGRTGLKLGDDMYARAFYKRRDEENHHSGRYQNRWLRQTAGMVVESYEGDDKWTLRLGGHRSQYRINHSNYRIDRIVGAVDDISEQATTIDSHGEYLHFDFDQTINSEWQAKYAAWYQHSRDQRFDAPAEYSDVNLEANFNYGLSDRVTFSFGGGVRRYDIDFSTTHSPESQYIYPYILRTYDVNKVDDVISNGYVQGNWHLTEQWSLWAGVKAEYFSATGDTEFSPQLRALYHFDDGRNTLWAGVARAVSAPSYLNRNSDYYLTIDDPQQNRTVFVKRDSNPNMDIESVITSEVGHRFVGENIELDTTLFFSEHHNVRGSQYKGAIEGVNNSYQFQISDDYNMKSYGVEVAARWQFSSTYDIYASYSYLHTDYYLQMDTMQQVQTTDAFSIENQHNISLQSLWDINEQWSFDVTAMAQLLEYPPDSNYSIPDYLSWDARLAWQYNTHWPMVEWIIKDIGRHGYYQNTLQQYPSEQQSYLRISYVF
ncbi:TonB-dependent receptor plug domain-containing protein [Vibrio olivae]|uniref:TonB-dependent receptor plug domain-containing protein n=1 Tax=Vibrio olivae TaxID=1243002 RepID=A0ABV5HSE6_9VIBR